ncbi:DUF4184 family protein [Flavobacterium cellulosilyticum]|uniref:DUF4184 family protein n=1 Tax=Flavobacterium cellulosilyticum TaxID=2541731 RepID=A0A4R5CBS6_9FLAO|nr:DUF4184 family protein [Flavobacterium cellulosilyticum]TDD94584.1 DUF4184 family protein [Flavobacterium cellulosilyticum]
MPFTFSHPAIILPFLKNKKLSATALIAGSMSPDYEYFFRMKGQLEFGHTFLGIFLIDLPLGLIVMFAFHGLIKKVFIENSPVFLQERLQELKEFNWVQYFKSNVFTVLISFFLGAFSHLLWDSFTHSDGFFVERFPFFYYEVGSFSVYVIAIYVIAQYVCSLIGLILIFIYIYNLPKSNTKINTINMNYWYLNALLSVIIIAIRFYFGTPMDDIGIFIVSILTPIIIAITISGIVFRKKSII